jgi:hypothetical protein
VTGVPWPIASASAASTWWEVSTIAATISRSRAVLTRATSPASSAGPSAGLKSQPTVAPSDVVWPPSPAPLLVILPVLHNWSKSSR